jgi:hypothetical protein
LLGGALLIQAGRTAATGPLATPSAPSGGPVAVAPGALPAITATGGANGTTVVSSSPATALYPYYAGAPGIAPDHTIVVTGVGQADVQSDGTNRTAAQSSAIAAALTDAKAQADAVASSTGLSISGVLSVSVSASPNYGITPMAGSSGSACIEAVPGSGPQATGKAVLPQPVCPPAPQPVYPQTITVSATVAYRVG